MGLSILLSLLLGVPIPAPDLQPSCHCGVPSTPTPIPEPIDDDEWDDDWADDDDDTWADDDDDDDASDDDDSTPPYTGEIDMGGALLLASCTVTVAEEPGGAEDAEGWYDFAIELEGWADVVWIELRDQLSDYCEGYDPATGDPCEWEGYHRPGWGMDNTDFGWSQTDGFWDIWELSLPYHEDLATAAAMDASWFLCEEAGQSFDTWFCGVDLYSGLRYCTAFDLESW